MNREQKDWGKEIGNFLEDLMNDGPVAQYLEEQDKQNREIVHRMAEINAPAELIEDVLSRVAQNANTVLFLIDELRRVYPDYCLYPAREAERLNNILEIITCVAEPMVTYFNGKDGKDFEKQGRP